MRIRIHWAIPFVARLLIGVTCGVGCNSDKAGSSSESPPAGAATAEATAGVVAEAKLSLVTPTIGGSVLAVGDHQIELAILENGQVQGLVYDLQGKPLAAAERPKVSVALRTQGGGRPSASLAWDAPHACWQGRAQLEAGLVREPIDVSLEVRGKLAAATLSDYGILPFARFGGSALGVGPYAVELVAKPELILAYVLDATGKAQAAGDLALELRVGAGAGTQLDFQWDAARACYTASLGQSSLHGKLDVSAQPLRLGLTAAGQAYVGAVRSLNAVAALRLGARAQLDAPQLGAGLRTGAKALGGARASLDTQVKTGARALAKAQASASVKLPAPSVKVGVKKSVSAGASAQSNTSSKAKAKASAGVKGSAGLSLGR